MRTLKTLAALTVATSLTLSGCLTTGGAGLADVAMSGAGGGMGTAQTTAAPAQAKAWTTERERVALFEQCIENAERRFKINHAAAAQRQEVATVTSQLARQSFAFLPPIAAMALTRAADAEHMQRTREATTGVLADNSAALLECRRKYDR